MNGAQRRVSALHVIGEDTRAIGGDVSFATNLCAALSAAGDTVSLLSLGDAAGVASVDGYQAHTHRWDFHGVPILSQLRLSAGLRRNFARVAASHDVVHGHGLWTAPSRFAVDAAARIGRPAVLSPHGSLSPHGLAVSRLKKSVFLALLDRPMLRRVTCFHATSAQECDDLRAHGLRQPVAIIPVGVEIPASDAGQPRRDTTVLFVGRLHPIKGLDGLLQAWASVSPRHPGWRLKIVGPGEPPHVMALKRQAQSLGLADVEFTGPLVGEAKAAAYSSASLFVLPSRAENFGITVAEALAHGLPVIATRGTPWGELAARGCGWWIDPGAPPLAQALNEALALPAATLARMGASGRAWAAEAFSWDRVAAQMHAVYAWLLGRAERPACVRD